MKQLHVRTIGIIYGILSAIILAAYLTLNRAVYVYSDISPMLYAVVLIAVAGVIGGIRMIWLQSWRQWRGLRLHMGGLLGLALVSGLGTFFILVGQAFTSNTNTAMITTLIVVATSVAARIFLGERLQRQQVVWGGFALVGAYLGIVGLDTLSFSGGDLLCLLGVIFFGLTNIIAKILMKGMPHHIVVDVRLMLCGLVAAGSLFFFPDVTKTPWPVLWAITLAAFLYWLMIVAMFEAIRRIHPGEASMLNQSQLLMTIPIAILFFGETLSYSTILGLGFITISLIFFLRSAASKN